MDQYAEDYLNAFREHFGEHYANQVTVSKRGNLYFVKLGEEEGRLHTKRQIIEYTEMLKHGNEMRKIDDMSPAEYPYQKQAEMAILSSPDGAAPWKPVAPGDVPDWLKEDSVIRALVSGEMAHKPGGLWYRAHVFSNEVIGVAQGESH